MIDRSLEVRVDRERLSVFKGGRETLVRPYPISIDFEMIDEIARSQDLSR
jgi:trehalose-6-phosphate synthase